MRSMLLALLISWSTVAVSWSQDQSRPAPILENSIGMKLVLVPSGEFLMGSEETPEQLAAAFPKYERDRFTSLGDEAPVHKVRITKPFFFGQYEVTVGQFRKYLELSGNVPESIADKTGGYGYNPNYDPSKTVKGDAFEGRDPKYAWNNPGFKQTDDHPVLNVSWNDAKEMCEWLSKKEGRKYRLPSEAEWEYACRAGTRTRYHGGQDPESLIEVANSFDQDTEKNWQKWKPFALAGRDGFEFTAPVGSFKPNAFGLYDMHGNAWEWCEDWHSDTYYAESPLNDPPGPKEGVVRVRRGGSWHTWSFYARSAFRNWNDPSTRYTLVGMRLVCEFEEPKR